MTRLPWPSPSPAVILTTSLVAGLRPAGSQMAPKGHQNLPKCLSKVVPKRQKIKNLSKSWNVWKHQYLLCFSHILTQVSDHSSVQNASQILLAAPSDKQYLTWHQKGSQVWALDTPSGQKKEPSGTPMNTSGELLAHTWNKKDPGALRRPNFDWFVSISGRISVKFAMTFHSFQRVLNVLSVNQPAS